MRPKMFNHDRTYGFSKQSEHRQFERVGGCLPAVLSIITSDAHAVAHPGKMLLAVATEHVRLYTLFLSLEP
jgi:hypothetical protein